MKAESQKCFAKGNEKPRLFRHYRAKQKKNKKCFYKNSHFVIILQFLADMFFCLVEQSLNVK